MKDNADLQAHAVELLHQFEDRTSTLRLTPVLSFHVGPVVCVKLETNPRFRCFSFTSSTRTTRGSNLCVLPA